MITFFISILVLLLGYFFYSGFMERIEGINPDRQTPAFKLRDDVDYVPMPWWRVFLIQFLNIAGLGPIFGAVAGAMWGPVAFLWIVLGSVFAGAVHDYFSGMLSIRHNGLSITEIVGIYLGNGAKQFMRGFTVILIVIFGTISEFHATQSPLLARHTSINARISALWCIILINTFQSS